MGLLTNNKVLKWEENQFNIKKYKELGLNSFVRMYNTFKENKSIPYYWGYEMEYMLLKKENENFKLNIIGNKLINRLSNNEGDCWFPEYANWMIEKIPNKPFSPKLEELLILEEQINSEITRMNHILGKNEYVIMLTSYPLLGTKNFYIFNGAPYNNYSKSKYVPDNVINPHIRFKTLTENIRKRRRKKIDIDIPIYKDQFTIENKIEMDCMAFGMGNCCAQITIQCEGLDHAMMLYDQFAILSPFLLALSAACPILKGKLSDHDTRWRVIEQAVDDRKPEDKLKKSRYSTINYFISPNGVKYNDIEDEYNEDYYNNLVNSGIPSNLSKHVAYLFARDPLIMYEEDLNDIKKSENESNSFFININSSNWNNVRLKPPMNSNDSWKVEIRVLEMQTTSFENSSFFIFIILLAKTITYYKLDFYIPISEVDNNFEKSIKKDSKNSKYYFKRNVKGKGKIDLLFLSEIYDILFKYIYDYLETLNDNTFINKISKYLEHIKLLSNGLKQTIAEKIREFILNHKEYKNDSNVNQIITNELIQKILSSNN